MSGGCPFQGIGSVSGSLVRWEDGLIGWFDVSQRGIPRCEDGFSSF